MLYDNISHVHSTIPIVQDDTPYLHPSIKLIRRAPSSSSILTYHQDLNLRYFFRDEIMLGQLLCRPRTHQLIGNTFRRLRIKSGRVQVRVVTDSMG